MAPQQERDFPLGHPASSDYDPDSPEAIEWRRINVHPKGERDWPVDHPKAVDTPGNTNHVPIIPGVDPAHPERESFTGRSPDKAKRVRELQKELAALSHETPPAEPVIAPKPPPPGDISLPPGQPGDIDTVPAWYRALQQPK
jgi:hypothetical protein